MKAVNELTGANIWSTPTSSAVESSPAVSGGIVYVGTDDGTLYAFDETTGAQQWATKLSARHPLLPAVDPVHSTVVVGDRSGHVTALATADRDGRVVHPHRSGGHRRPDGQRRKGLHRIDGPFRVRPERCHRGPSCGRTRPRDPSPPTPSSSRRPRWRWDPRTAPSTT